VAWKALSSMRAALSMLAIAGLAAGAASQADFQTARRRMLEEITRMIAATAADTGIAQLDPRVLEALSAVPRHEFVPDEHKWAAYSNRPLPIGQGQTISQPYIVALMTELLGLRSTDKVLEVGTGSGYQAAVLSRLAHEVYSIEIVAALGHSAREALSALGYANVWTRIGDGYQGWPENAPYDAIIVTAAPDHIPPALTAQLKPGGRLVIPVGTHSQHLLVLTKHADGTADEKTIVPVRFVPLRRE
jgi:protein-L-isoaspartate(D-aspartate) O-methyltransferase